MFFGLRLKHFAASCPWRHGSWRLPRLQHDEYLLSFHALGGGGPGGAAKHLAALHLRPLLRFALALLRRQLEDAPVGVAAAGDLFIFWFLVFGGCLGWLVC
jgi:hypothetical protein